MGIIIAITVNFQAPYASNLEDVKKSYSEYSIGNFNDSLRHFIPNVYYVYVFIGVILENFVFVSVIPLYFLYYLKENYIECFIPLGINKFFVSKKDRVM